jgi:GNAT superfamily N-acetyltransferase
MAAESPLGPEPTTLALGELAVGALAFGKGVMADDGTPSRCEVPVETRYCVQMSDPNPTVRELPVIRELSGPEVALGYAAMHELRGHRPPLASPETFVTWVSEHGDGYRLAGAFLPGESGAAAVIGFRTMTLLYAGRTLYVDDLSTRADHRGQGLGRALLAWAEAEARRLGCEELHLDSGMQRFPAHRLYLKFGFDISAHHFSKVLG